MNKTLKKIAAALAELAGQFVYRGPR